MISILPQKNRFALSAILLLSCCIGKINAQEVSIGQYYYELGLSTPDSAYTLFQKSYHEAVLENDSSLILITLNAWAQTGLRQGRHQEVMDKLLAELSKPHISKQPSVEYYQVLKTYENSTRVIADNALPLKIINEILQVNEALYGDQHPDRVEYLVLKGLLLREIGHYSKGLMNLRKALSLGTELFGGSSIQVAEICNSLGLFYASNGDYERALHYYGKSSQILDQTGPANYPYYHHALSVITNNMARLKGYKHNYLQALALQDRAIDHNSKAQRLNPNLYLSKAVYLTKLDRPQEAHAYFDQAIQICKREQGGKHPLMANIHRIKGDYYTQLGEYDSANYHLQQALGIVGTDNTLSMEVYHVYVGLGKLYAAQGSFDKALNYYNSALQYFFPDFDPQNPWDNPDIDFAPFDNGGIVVSEVLIKKGEALAKMPFEPAHRGEEYALQCYMKALRSYKKQINVAPSDGSKFTLSEAAQNIYTHALDVCYSLYKDTGDQAYTQAAFEVMESSRAYILYHNLMTRGISEELLPQTIRSEYGLLKHKLEKFKMQYVDAHRQELEVAHLRDSILNIENRIGHLNDRVGSEYPWYYKHQSEISQAKLSDLRSILPDNTVAIQFFQHTEGYYILSSSSDKSHLSHISPVDLNTNVKDITDFKTTYYDLYTSILKPVLDNFSLVSNILIMPDGDLNRLSFEMMLTESAGQLSNYSQLPYLIKSKSISYHLSANLYILNHAADKEVRQTNVMAYAPSYSHTTETLLASRSSKDTLAARRLPALPMAAQEVRQIAELYGINATLDESATELSFKQQAPHADIIHLASHTVIDENNPLYSKIIFSPGADTLEDGLLHTYELYQMNINADLVCLSACNTGVGKYYTGEGSMSLARSFMYAGTPNVIMSLWSVPDRSTSMIMKSFHTHLKEGMNKVEALRQAKLDYLAQADANTASPHYWGGFIYIGNPDAGTDNRIHFYIITMLAGAGLLLFVGKKFIGR